MNRPSPLPCASALSSLLLGVALAAQSNTITGLDAALTDGSGPTYQGRRGAAHPTGEIALSWALTTCNVGTANIQWDAPMDERHPFFAMAVVRLANGRPEQITRPAETYVKHGFGIGTPLDCGGTCQPTGLGLGMHCSDVYGSFSNANRFFLGPAGEIDPWLGDWVAVGSYFDRGDPDVGPPGNQDGVRSLLHGSGNFPSDPVKNRVTLPESEVLAAGRLFYCSQLVVRGEDGDLRADDLGHRELAASYAAPDWTFADVGTWQTGSVLESWPGATVGRARNGDDDGHFVVAVVATDLGGGQWHYEYAVHDVDNARGGAALRVPLCPTANAGNFTFRDTDDNPLNDWTAVVVGGELAFQAAAGNALEWNNIFNFGFDCDGPPVAAAVAIDEARPGPGALTVPVPSLVPGGAITTALGPGCGSPAPALAANGAPTLPNPAFALDLTAAPSASLLLFVAPTGASVALAPGCLQHVANQGLVTLGFLVADGSGTATTPFPLPANLALEGLTLHWQGAEFVTGGPVFANFALTNGIATRLACR